MKNEEVIRRFLDGTPKGKSHSLNNNGDTLTQHGNVIARWIDKTTLEITDAGWNSTTTKKHLNTILDFSGFPYSMKRIVQYNWNWYLVDFKQPRVRTPWEGHLTIYF